MTRVDLAVELDIACGGDPLAALLRTAPVWNTSPGQIVRLTVHHDDGCPCLQGWPMPNCTCEVVGLRASRVG
jgi:hypothetical protein